MAFVFWILDGLDWILDGIVCVCDWILTEYLAMLVLCNAGSGMHKWFGLS